MNIEEKIVYLKEAFDKFLKKNNAYDAWYERYRLDNLMYNDEVPIEDFLEDVLQKDEYVHSMLYDGVRATCLPNKNGEKFIEENKKCDILSNGTIANLDGKWMDTWKTLVDVNLLW